MRKSISDRVAAVIRTMESRGVSRKQVIFASDVSLHHGYCVLSGRRQPSDDTLRKMEKAAATEPGKAEIHKAVMSLLAEGCGPKYVADALGLELHTVIQWRSGHMPGGLRYHD